MIIINTYMKKFFSLFKRNTGFTLIELLVVIGILGILAAALIATIDPFEQLKKASDANIKNTTVEFTDASIRYFTTHNELPWANPVAPANCKASNPISQNLTGTQMASCLGDANTPNTLIGDGELKAGFTTVTSILQSIFISGTTNGVTACFQPQSKSQRADPNTKYDATGNIITTNTCISQGGAATTCYWCSE